MRCSPKSLATGSGQKKGIPERFRCVEAVRVIHFNQIELFELIRIALRRTWYADPPLYGTSKSPEIAVVSKPCFKNWGKERRTEMFETLKFGSGWGVVGRGAPLKRCDN